MDDAKLTRRGSLAGMAGLLLGLAGWKAAGSEGAGPAAVASGAVSCVLTPEQTEGPYYIAGEKYRRNITEGHSGVPLYLRLRVIDASTCRPIAGAAVERRPHRPAVLPRLADGQGLPPQAVQPPPAPDDAQRERLRLRPGRAPLAAEPTQVRCGLHRRDHDGSEPLTRRS